MRRRRSPKEIDDYKRKWKLGEYNNIPNHDHSRWCIENGYRIYREPYGLCSPVCTQFKIVVEKDGIKKMGTKVYNKKEIGDAVWSAISYIYNKYGKKTKTI
tara:strand:+ start:3843 stop:4145 length:303 start_codon:yes stop_codon:yes gene_type:complete